jgi:hypothetical protein
VENARDRDLNKINNLRSLFFLQREAPANPALDAPQHCFCVQVKAATGENPRIVS